MQIVIEYQSGVFKVSESVGQHLQTRHLGTFQKEHSKNYYILDPLEVLYLIEKRSSIQCIGFKVSSRQQFLSKFKITMQEFLVFCDLQKKGYVVKQALKFGATFRIYKKTNGKVETHASHLVFVCEQKKKISPEELFSINRVAHSTKKHILFAYVDYELSVSYLEQKRWS